jgi:hypothetical protein
VQKGQVLGTTQRLNLRVRRQSDGVEVVIEGVGAAPELQQTTRGAVWMGRLLTSRALGAIFTEVSLPHLARAGCSQQGLLDLLNRHDYQVKNPNGPRGHWSWDILARLISDNTQGGPRVPSAGV